MKMKVWRPIKTAPRDGTRVRLKADDGTTYAGQFKSPHWWNLGGGAARLADGELYKDEADLMRAVEWQEITP